MEDYDVELEEIERGSVFHAGCSDPTAKCVETGETDEIINF